MQAGGYRTRRRSSGRDVGVAGVGLDMNEDSTAARTNSSFLAAAESRAVRWLLPQVPPTVTPLHLTLVGMAGAFVTAAGLIGCNWSLAALPLVFVGIGLNWLGDSLDGQLARYRRIERPRFGFLVDHSTDLLAQVVMILAFGFSPFLSLLSALIVLCVYLLFSAYTYVSLFAGRVHKLSYGGMAASEFRILMVGWTLVGAMYGPRMLAPTVGSLSNVDIVIAALSVAAVLLLVNVLVTELRRIAEEEENPAVARLALAGKKAESRVVSINRRKP